MYLKVDEFQAYILELWKNEEEINRVLSSTQHGDEQQETPAIDDLVCDHRVGRYVCAQPVVQRLSA